MKTSEYWKKIFMYVKCVFALLWWRGKEEDLVRLLLPSCYSSLVLSTSRGGRPGGISLAPNNRGFQVLFSATFKLFKMGVWIDNWRKRVESKIFLLRKKMFWIEIWSSGKIFCEIHRKWLIYSSKEVWNKKNRYAKKL